MLTTLRISGFAIVDQVEVRFGPGLNVLTGETGAGKSILVEALHLVLGGRLGADVLRDGADEAAVAALFELPPGHPVWSRLEAAGLPPGDRTELLVRRVAARNGRGRAFVNGALCTVGMLESCLHGLVDVTGQHQHVALLDERTHLSLLDSFVGSDRGPGGALERYRAEWNAFAGAVRSREALEGDREERARRAEYVAHQLREIDALAPRSGEDGELERERGVLAASERLRAAARAAEALVYGDDGSAAERVGRAVRLLDVAALDARLEPMLALLRSALAEAEEAGRSLARYADAIGGDPERLAAVEERLAALRALARKHGGTLDSALERAGEMRVELEATQSGGERLAQLEVEVAEAGARAAAGARELTRLRTDGARSLAHEVRRDLEALGMARCRVEVEFLPPEGALPAQGVRLGADGAERVRILLGPNPGEAARPLARIASGGELSRVLLALKRALARADPVDTYVFDEVDAGIGGSVAEAVGRALSDISRCRQVVCVTHLPQVAAFADRHLKVEKRVHGGRTGTSVLSLESGCERREEVARMLAGATITRSALQHARALIAGAHDVPAANQAPPSSRGRSAAERSAGARSRVIR